MNFYLEICNNSSCHFSVFFRIENYYGGRAMFVFSFRSRGRKHEDVHMELEMKINHTGKALAVFVWKLLRRFEILNFMWKT